jgi:hypothetical protein
MASIKHQPFTHGELIEEIREVQNEVHEIHSTVDEVAATVDQLSREMKKQKICTALADARATGFALLSFVLGVLALTLALQYEISNFTALLIEAGVLGSMVTIILSVFIEIVVAGKGLFSKKGKRKGF